MGGDEEGGSSNPFMKEECEAHLSMHDYNLGNKVYKFCMRSCGLMDSFTNSNVSDDESTCLKSCASNFMTWKNTYQPMLVTKIQASFVASKGGDGDEEDEDDD